jgi:uncharacterized protein
MKTKVYFAPVPDGASPAEQAEALGRALLATGFMKRLAQRDFVAIKLHVGEKNNITHLRPELAAKIVALVDKAKGQPFLTDTSTLYKSQRDNAIRHAMHAHAHGFGIEAVGAPFFALDGLSGTHEREVEVNGELNRTVKVAGEVLLADAIVVLAHATGHIGCGLGAAIKTVGMGLASRAGKMRQHSTISPKIDPKECTGCGKCRKWCPADAITSREVEKGQVSFIVKDKCIGCGECLAVCRFSAVEFNWGSQSPALQKSMVEHAAGALRGFGDKAVHINVMTDMTRECDCMNIRQKKLIPDLGIIASNDIVAVDQAALDLTAKAHGKDLSRLAYPRLNPSIQLEHAVKMGLGEREYELVEV